MIKIQIKFIEIANEWMHRCVMKNVRKIKIRLENIWIDLIRSIYAPHRNDLGFILTSGANLDRKARWFWAVLSHRAASSDTISRNISLLLSLHTVAMGYITNLEMDFIMALDLLTIAELSIPSNISVPGVVASIKIWYNLIPWP